MSVYDDPVKRNARQSTVIDLYREIRGVRSVPRGRQYWTLCGPMTRAGVLAPSCELMHLLDERLLSPGQFYGAELKKSSHEANAAAAKKAFGKGESPRLFGGNIVDGMAAALRRRELAPDVVNLDTESEPPKAIHLLDSVVSIVNHVPGPVVVVWNTVMKNPHNNARKYDFETISGLMAKDMSLQRSLKKGGWGTYATTFKYGGYGSKSRSVMGTVAFHKGVP